MSGTLSVVATPIGNLEDITLRALRVLREVAVIAAEDTRRTARLLQRYGISTPTISFHEHNTRSRLPQLIARMQAGDNVAVVSDAGMPGLSDPGLELVRACIDEHIAVDVIPGASAALTALIASGFPTAPATFRGFPPSMGNARKSWVLAAAEDPATVVIFESPHRIASLLDYLTIFSGKRQIMVGRELTKVHQELLRGLPSEVRGRLKTLKGEFTIVLCPIALDRRLVPSDASAEQLILEFRYLTETSGLGRRQAITTLSKRHTRNSKEIYSLLESAKNRSDDLP